MTLAQDRLSGADLLREDQVAEKLAVSGGPRVPMMQAADLENRDHLSFGGMLDSTRHRSVSFQRRMSAGFVVVREIACQDPAQVGFVEHDHVIQAFATD